VDTCGFVEKFNVETHLAPIGSKCALQERGILLCFEFQGA
jgi:hypothetical protein